MSDDFRFFSFIIGAPIAILLLVGLVGEIGLPFLAISAVVGWLAGLLMHGKGFGLIGNIIIGSIGTFIGGYLLIPLTISLGFGDIPEGIGVFVVLIGNYVIGAVVLLFIIKLIIRNL